MKISNLARRFRFMYDSKSFRELCTAMTTNSARCGLKSLDITFIEVRVHNNIFNCLHSIELGTEQLLKNNSYE